MKATFDKAREALNPLHLVSAVSRGYKALFAVEGVTEDHIRDCESEYIAKRRTERKNHETEQSFYRHIGEGERPKLDLIYRISGLDPSPLMKDIIKKLGEECESEDRCGAKSTIGLSLSGGGIRSASFCLGAIQALIKYRIFQNVDYMSTVSGGGYIGSAFSSMYSHHQFGFDFTHKRGEPEPAPFRYLRNHANYLLPKGAIDLFRMIAVILRGLLANLLVLSTTLIIVAWIATQVVGPYRAWWNGLYHLAGGFPLTIFYAALTLVVMFGLRFLADRFWQKIVRFVFGRKPEENWISRNKSEMTMAGMLIATAAVAAIEGHFLLIDWLAIKMREQPELVYAGLLGFAPLLVRLAPASVLKELKSLAARYTMIAIGVAGVAVFVGIYLGLAAAITAGTYTYLSEPYLSWLVLAAVAAQIIVALLADFNQTSLHDYYRDRLSKAFLFKFTNNGGSLKDDVVHVDNLWLSGLQDSVGPYHLINAAVNMKAPDESYQKGRKADFFLFSPCFVGSQSTGYCRTGRMEAVKPHVNLGTAMAISGAAAAPNAGGRVNPFLTFILAATNVRLNYWLPNPGHLSETYQNRFLRGTQSTFNSLTQRYTAGPNYLWREMLGLTNADGRLINVSDGGHIENMGLYQLLKRRCAFIIVCDGEHDPKMQFSGLLEAVRIAQIDLGIRIKFDGLDEIRLGKQSHAVGIIEYSSDDDAEERTAKTGILLYLKSSLLGDSGLQDSLGQDQFSSSQYRHDREFYDSYSYIAQYRATHPDFPHETTGDQFFGEQQFECYRALGYIVAEDAIAARSDAPRLRQ